MNDKKAPPAALEKAPAQVDFEKKEADSARPMTRTFFRLAADRRRRIALLRELRMGLLGAYSRERMLEIIEEELLRQ